VAPNPLASNNTLKYKVNAPAQIKIIMYDGAGRVVKLLADKRQDAGTYTLNWSAASLTAGKYYISISKNGSVSKTLSLVKAK
jgi:flagellar hook assembly protein FlgD